jgi:predicted 3-demethylubiquinone-9 3-methyltransferase (glyoxalase superfamily)
VGEGQVMTQDEIIEMARWAGFKMENSAAIQAAKVFAKLVAAKEREAIEKLFEELSDNTEPHKDYEDYDDGWVDACYACKLAVTSRGEA